MSEELSLNWKKAQALVLMVASILIPVVLAVYGQMATSNAKQQELAVKYVEIAIGILKKEPKKETENIRGWAIETINFYASTKLNDATKNELNLNPVYESLISSQKKSALQVITVLYKGGINHITEINQLNVKAINEGEIVAISSFLPDGDSTIFTSNDPKLEKYVENHRSFISKKITEMEEVAKKQINRD